MAQPQPLRRASVRCGLTGRPAGVQAVRVDSSVGLVCCVFAGDGSLLEIDRAGRRQVNKHGLRRLADVRRQREGGRSGRAGRESAPD